MAMPERIWAWGNNKIAWWHDKPECGATEYIRADLAVLATTHQRTLEALREAEKAMEEAREPLKIFDWGALAKIDAALARIKEAT